MEDMRQQNKWHLSNVACNTFNAEVKEEVKSNLGRCIQVARVMFDVIDGEQQDF
jgi:hypothetical protein